MIPFLTIQSLGKSYGNTDLFSNLSFDIKPGERLGLIGINGSGKSTLLKIIAGNASPDEGESKLKSRVRCIYVPQTDETDPEISIEMALNIELKKYFHGEKELARAVNRALGTGGFQNSRQKCGSLSGGLVKRLAITRAAACEPDLLLLDEPTNHLDINGIIWLENLLAKSDFTFIVVTHDRYFLNSVCNQIMELGRQYPYGYLRIRGDYDRFNKEKIKLITARQNQQTSLASRMKREDQWLKQGAKARTTKSKFRINQAENLRQELSELKEKNRENVQINIDFCTTGRKTRQLVTVSNIEKSFNNKKIFEPLSLKLMRNSCLGVVGENGSGKSTFINILAGNIQPDSGRIQWVENLKTGFLDQKRSNLDPDITLKQALSPTGKDMVIFRNRPIHIISWAKKFLFSPKDLDMPVKRFSGGEKAKILIAKLMLEPADLLLLDEPGNDLDIPSLQILEQSILEFQGAVVVVSHDRYFLKKVADQILYLNKKGRAELFADYDQILHEKHARAKKNRSIKAKKLKKRIKTKKNNKIKLTFNEKYELEHMEEKILKIDNIIQGIQESINDPETAKNPEKLAQLCSRLQEQREQSDKLYERWDYLENKQNLYTAD